MPKNRVSAKEVENSAVKWAVREADCVEIFPALKEKQLPSSFSLAIVFTNGLF